jgi:hypothetical protein
LLCLLLVLGGIGCAGHAPLHTGTGNGTATPAMSTPAGFPPLPSISRLRAAVGDDFLIQQPGASFSADLPSNRCVAQADKAVFTPQWSAAAANPAGSAAYAIYRLTYDPQAAPITLSLAWEGAPPADADCWIGLSDWTGSIWRWQQPVDGQVELANPEQYVDGSQHCYVAVLILGETPCSLATIGFGTPPPPPPPPPSGDGYTLIAPLEDTKTYLIDMAGTVVKQWTSGFTPGAAAVLLENGHLMRAASIGNPIFPAGGRAGRLEEYDWDGNLVWYYELSTSTQCTHHDFTRLPNGNILLIVSNLVAPADIAAAGRDPNTVNSSGFFVDSLIEIQPTLPSGGNVVWEWHLTDHLVQDFSDSALNFGNPADHPELVDLNFPPGGKVGDWTHFNCVAYNPDLDQVMVTSLIFSEFWVIDHSTTTAEAAGHTGGHSGHGGDILYRWGNPQAYGAGTTADQQFFGCHNAHWIADGLPGAGNILVFKNLTNNMPFSQVVELVPPLQSDGTYTLTDGAYGPESPVWSYQGDPPTSFYSTIMGSAQRLPDGQTLINSGVPGTVFSVDPSGVIQWQYQNIYPSQGTPLLFRAPRYLLDYPGVANLQQPAGP